MVFDLKGKSFLRRDGEDRCHECSKYLAHGGWASTSMDADLPSRDRLNAGMRCTAEDTERFCIQNL